MKDSFGTVYASKLITPNFKAIKIFDINNDVSRSSHLTQNVIVPSSDFTVGDGTKFLFVSSSFLGVRSNYIVNINYTFKGNNLSTPLILTQKVVMNIPHDHKSFSYNRVITNNELPAGTYTLSVSYNDGNYFSDYLHASLLELPI